MILLVTFAFLAGIITVLSPCILPILPIVLSSSIGPQKIGLLRPVGVVLGFISSFTFFTLFLSTIVRLSGIPADTLRLFSVVIIAVFGASMLIPSFQFFIEKLFSKLGRITPNGQNKTGLGGGLLIGFSVGLLWTPCVGPILASVISLAIVGTVNLDVFIITLSYSIGTAIPMFLIILGGQNALKRVPWLLSNLSNIQKVFGILMILTSIAIFLNLDRKFQTFVLEKFPQYGAGLTRFEDNEIIHQQLDAMDKTQKSQSSGIGKSSSLNASGPKAAEIVAGGVWFNSKPLSINSLKGKVILLDFWTYTCINCQRTLPYLKKWNEKYKDMGLVVIGVHSPEFEFEKSEKNVRMAISDFGISYPVVQDNNFETWRNYNNRFWPAKYLIDVNSKVRYTHFGEGSYDETEKNIQELIRETGQNVNGEVDNGGENKVGFGFGEQITPETYLGSARADRFDLGKLLDGLGSFELNEKPPTDNFSLGGIWNVSQEYIETNSKSILALNFNAKNVHLVITSGNKKSKVKVTVNGLEAKDIVLDGDRLYDLVSLEKQSRNNLKIEFTDPGIRIFAFTFG